MNLSKYVDLEVQYALYGEDGYYIEPLIVHTMIVDELKLGMSFYDMKQFVKGITITLTEEEIQQFLEQKMKEEEPGLKESLKESMKISSIITLTGNPDEVEKRIRASHKKMQDIDKASRYRFEPFSLQYLKGYVSNLKEKLISMFDVLNDLENIKNGEIDEDGWKRILDLDFHVNKFGNLYASDVVRLVDAIVYNVKDLYDTVNKGNQLETYLTFKLSEHDLLKNDVWPSEVYPSKKIRVKSLSCQYDKQFIALSEHQVEQLKNEQNQFLSRMIAEDFREDDVEETTRGSESVLKKSIK